ILPKAFSTSIEIIILFLSFSLWIYFTFYAVTLVRNVSIIILIRNCSQLHTPTYLFLSHLAFVDSGCMASVTPMMLIGFLRQGVTITAAGCEAQLCFVVMFVSAECFLLASMAYDHYVAICLPLLYSTHVPQSLCSLDWGFLTGCLLTLSFCGPNQIDHFFYDFSPLLKLSCSDVSPIKIIPSISSGSTLAVTVFVIALSYVYILSTILKITILKMRSTEGRHKAFSTCTSHFTTVTLYYGTITFIYVMPNSSYSVKQNGVVSAFYTVVITMLNPLIHNLRNRDVKEALRKASVRIYS
uniref:G-protein coupled receptors family 1 profile domain-containing protein n=1 Tax=Capra hircus TaxID=9925 RepID=A0A8C2RW07_CAPHI